MASVQLNTSQVGALERLMQGKKYPEAYGSLREIVVQEALLAKRMRYFLVARRQNDNFMHQIHALFCRGMCASGFFRRLLVWF
jgi:hypothetical protein